jgi:uncharacterized delta-60 repeat protein
MGGQGGMGGEPIQYWPEGFTANGISTTVDDRFHGVAIQGQNVYATGYLGDGVVMTGTTRQVVVAKFDSQARLVTGFGNMGLATVDLSNYAGLPVDATNTTADPSQETGRDIALQSDGKIIVVGVVERVTAMPPDRTTPLDIFVMRFDATGMPDTTLFNGGANGGVLYLSPGTVPSTNPIAYGVEIDAMNRIYVFAHGNATHATRTDQDRYVYRLNADGTPDMNFGTGGFFTFDQPGATATNPMTDNVRRGAVLANGNVIVAGYTPIINGKNEIVLARVLPGGTPDPSFSANGINTFRPYDDDGMAECYGVGVQSDGSLVTTGYGNPNTANSGSQFLDMISIRVRPDGRQDTTWAGSGRLSLDINSLEDRGRDILALPDDRILIAGAGTLTTGDKDSMLLLLDKDGMPTEDFVMDGTSRRLYGSFGSPGDEFFAVAQSPGTTGARMVAAAGYAPAGASLANGNGTLAVIPVPAP